MPLFFSIYKRTIVYSLVYSLDSLGNLYLLLETRKLPGTVFARWGTIESVCLGFLHITAAKCSFTEEKPHRRPPHIVGDSAKHCTPRGWV